MYGLSESAFCVAAALLSTVPELLMLNFTPAPGMHSALLNDKVKDLELVDALSRTCQLYVRGLSVDICLLCAWPVGYTSC